MWAKKYLLSICIPTYNREPYLKRLLDSIVSQEGFTDEVCIVINDWPSTDNTTEIVSSYQEKYDNVFYSKNSIAVWMLPAILESINMSKWEYTWLFWSDDFMQENALEIVINAIKKHSPKILLTNRFDVDNFEESRNYKNENQTVYSFQWFSDFWTYLWLEETAKFEDKHNYFTFMSVFCFNTNFYQSSLQFTQSNILDNVWLKKHYFNYILILFSKVFDSDIIWIIESPCLVFCQNNNHNRNHNKKISKDIKMLCNYIANNYALSTNAKKVLGRIRFRWYFMCNIVTPLKRLLSKLWIYNILSKLWRKYVLKNR